MQSRGGWACSWATLGAWAEAGAQQGRRNPGLRQSGQARCCRFPACDTEMKSSSPQTGAKRTGVGLGEAWGRVRIHREQDVAIVLWAPKPPLSDCPEAHILTRMATRLWTRPELRKDCHQPVPHTVGASHPSMMRLLS